jgi:protein-tyrosine kinase
VKRRHRKRTQEDRVDTVPDQSVIDDEVARGGLAVYERDGTSGASGTSLFHVVPPDVATSLRFLVARLQKGDEVAVRQSIAITSALAGEGVTSTARSLAAILANDLDRSVCLLETNWWSSDGDLATAPVRRLGLAGVLSGSCSVDEALMRTSDERLSVLTSGTMPMGGRPAAVGSSAFTDVLELLTKWFDTVLIDAPPVLTTSEATGIVRQAEATLLVIRQGVTTEQQVRTAIDDIGGVDLLGVIVNRSSTRVPRFLQRFTQPV